MYSFEQNMGKQGNKNLICQQLKNLRSKKTQKDNTDSEQMSKTLDSLLEKNLGTDRVYKEM